MQHLSRERAAVKVIKGERHARELDALERLVVRVDEGERERDVRARLHVEAAKAVVSIDRVE